MIVRVAACLALSVSLVLDAGAAGGPAKAKGALQGCSMSEAVDWSANKGPAYRAEAHANGSGKCADAAVTIVLRAPSGKALWVDAHSAENLMPFVGVASRADMQRALLQWLTQEHDFKTTGDLPEWKEGEEAPTSGDFPFYPDEGMDRDAYEEVRGEKSPVFCYVQGMESMACLALSKDGGVARVGLQLFPG